VLGCTQACWVLSQKCIAQAHETPLWLPTGLASHSNSGEAAQGEAALHGNFYRQLRPPPLPCPMRASKHAAPDSRRSHTELIIHPSMANSTAHASPTGATVCADARPAAARREAGDVVRGAVQREQRQRQLALPRLHLPEALEQLVGGLGAHVAHEVERVGRKVSHLRRAAPQPATQTLSNPVPCRSLPPALCAAHLVQRHRAAALCPDCCAACGSAPRPCVTARRRGCTGPPRTVRHPTRAGSATCLHNRVSSLRAALHEALARANACRRHGIRTAGGLAAPQTHNRQLVRASLRAGKMLAANPALFPNSVPHKADSSTTHAYQAARRAPRQGRC